MSAIAARQPSSLALPPAPAPLVGQAGPAGALDAASLPQAIQGKVQGPAAFTALPDGLAAPPAAAALPPSKRLLGALVGAPWGRCACRPVAAGWCWGSRAWSFNLPRPGAPGRRWAVHHQPPL